jgi:hypothetical protein
VVHKYVTEHKKVTEQLQKQLSRFVPFLMESYRSTGKTGNQEANMQGDKMLTMKGDKICIFM